METTSLPVTPAEKEAAAALKRRNDLLRELDIDNKTEVQKATARLDRVQLFLFLTECMENLINGKVLMSRPSANRFWCQTGFTIMEHIIYAKFGEGLMQPIGFDTGTEFWMTSGAKFLWKHEFCFVDTKAGLISAPYTIIVHERSEDNVGLTQGERDNLTRIAKDVGEVLDGRRPDDFVRDPGYKPNHAKAKYGPGELIELTRKFLEENEAKITAEAIKVANEKLEKGEFADAYAKATAEAEKAKQTLPPIQLWAQGTVASEMAEEAAAAYSQKLAAETVPYTEAELDDLAWQFKYKENCLDTLKYWSMNSKLLDQRLQKIHQEHPEVGENFEKADVVSLLASVAAWANTSVQDDRISRVIRNTEVKALVDPKAVGSAEATIAGRLTKPVIEARAALGNKIDELEENDPKLVRAMGVISQARVALPAVETKLQELEGVGLDVALDAIKDILLALAPTGPNDCLSATGPQGSTGVVG